MLIKTMSRKSNSGQLVAYVCRYILDPTKNKSLVPGPHHNKETTQVIIRHNLRARSSVKNFVKEFEENERYRLVRRKDSVKLFHTVIAFGKGDKGKVTDAILKDIGRQFIELRGKNNLFLGTIHRNTDSVHMHIIVSGTQLNGRSSRISKPEHQRIKVALEKYQCEKYPELIHSRVRHKEFTRQSTKEQIVAMVQQSRQTTKAALFIVLQQAVEKSINIHEFLTHVTASGYQPYHRGEKLQGVINESGTKFRFSKLGLQPSIDELQQKTIAAEEYIAELRNLRRGKQQVRQVVRPILNEQPIPRRQIDGGERKLLDKLVALRNNQISKENAVEQFKRLPTLFDDLEIHTEEYDQENNLESNNI